MDLELDIPGIKSAIEGMELDLDRLTKQARFVWPNEILGEAGKIAQQEIQFAIRRTTVTRTGTLVNSVQVVKEPDQVTVMVTAPYAGFINDGTNESPGRFVPAIGKRLVHGRTHEYKGRPRIPEKPPKVEYINPGYLRKHSPKTAPKLPKVVKAPAEHKTEGQKRTEAINRRAAHRPRNKPIKAAPGEAKPWEKYAMERKRPPL